MRGTKRRNGEDHSTPSTKGERKAEIKTKEREEFHLKRTSALYILPLKLDVDSLSCLELHRCVVDIIGTISQDPVPVRIAPRTPVLPQPRPPRMPPRISTRRGILSKAMIPTTNALWRGLDYLASVVFTSQSVPAAELRAVQP